MAFVGRSSELSTLAEVYRRVSRGDGRSVGVVGEPGIGKTSLVEQFVASVSDDGATVLRGFSADIEEEPPYAPWSRVLAPFRDSIFSEASRARLGASTDVIQCWLHPSRAASQREQRLSPNDERLILWDGIVTLLETAASERPVLIIIEDLHWADGDSLMIFRHVAQAIAGARVMLLGTCRDDGSPAAALLPRLVREVGLVRLTLRGFDVPETRALLLASGSHVPSALVSALHEETRGNAFFLRELWQHLIEEGRIWNEDGRWSSDFSLGEIGLPKSIYHLVDSRLRRLEDETVRVMRDGCFFRSGFTLSDLESVAPEESVTVLGALEQAVESGLVLAPRTAGGAYTFSHAIVKRALYEAINPDRRARIHRRLAEALAARPRASADTAGEVAAQYAASAAMPGADAGVPFALAAAERALESAAYEGAVRYLRIALTLSPTREQREEIFQRLVIAEAGALSVADASATATLALAEVSDVPRFCATAARALKEAGAARMHWEPFVERGLAACAARDLTWARLSLLRDNVEPVVSGVVNVSRWLGSDPEAVMIARRDGDELDWARTLNPYDPRSVEQTRQVLALARTWNHPLAIMRGLDAVARDLVYRQCEIKDATDCLEQLLDVSRRCGSISGQAEALAQISHCHLLLGNTAAGVKAHDQARKLADRLGPYHRVHALNLAVANVFAYNTGETSEIAASARALRAAASAAETGRGPLGLTLGAHAALASVFAGESRAAREILTALVGGIEATPEDAYLRTSAVAMAMIVCYELREQALARRLKVLAEEFDRAQIPSVFGSQALAVARSCVLDGDRDAALAAYARSADDSRSRGFLGQAVIADYERALLLSETQSVDAELKDVLERFEALGFGGRADRVRALLARAAAKAPVAATGQAPPADSSRETAATTEAPAGLTPREIEILILVAGGETNKEIAQKLFISVPTVQRHIANIYAKTDCRNRADATAYAIQHGLLGI